MNIAVFSFNFAIFVTTFLIIFVVEIFLIFLRAKFALTVILIVRFTNFIASKEKKRIKMNRQLTIRLFKKMNKV